MTNNVIADSPLSINESINVALYFAMLTNQIDRGIVGNDAFDEALDFQSEGALRSILKASSALVATLAHEAAKSVSESISGPSRATGDDYLAAMLVDPE